MLDNENLETAPMDLKMDYYPTQKTGDRGEYGTKNLKKYLKKIIISS